MTARLVDIAALFRSLQGQLEFSLGASRQIIIQSTAVGDAAEADWKRFLSCHLPSRYSCVRGAVVDHEGSVSDTIDVIVYDRHHTPVLFEHEATTYVPAESVYAVFEVKQTLNKETLEYAGSKAASVRRLKRTSTPIPHAGGVYEAKTPGHILGGILALCSGWTPAMGDALRSSLLGLDAQKRLDIGCVVRDGAFCLAMGKAGAAIEVSNQDQALLFFIIRLLEALRPLATVPAMDFSAWTVGRMPTSQL